MSETYLEEYREEIRKGNIIAGNELITGLDMFIDQLNDSRFIYNRRDALFRMDFMENFVKLTKSPFYGKPMKLMLWQKAFIECLYSFKIADTGNDRFKKSVLLIARKNTKSETCNGLGLTELMLGNAGSDIVASSNDDAQANILYEGMNVMRELFDPNDKYTSKNLSFIKNKLNNSKIYKLSDRTRNKEGRNIDVAFIDEVHEMKDKVIINSIEQSMSVKLNGKCIIITTEGFVQDGALDSELDTCRKVLAGELEDVTLMPWLYTQDSEAEIWQDPSTWQKSNPTLGIVKQYDYLQSRLDKAKIDKADRVFTLCKDFNIKQATNESWFLPSEVDYESEPIKPDMFTSAIALAAVDLSETTDMTCCHIMIMVKDDRTKYVFSHYWIPETKLATSNEAAYKDWARQGYLTVCEGSDNDLRSVVDDYIAAFAKLYGIRVFKTGYDQKFAKVFTNRMEEYGFETEVIYQNPSAMGTPMRMVEADIKNRVINYGNNPITRWCLHNACVQVDNLGRPSCVKIAGQPHMRIDGAVNLIILYAIYWRHKDEYARYAEGNEKVI